MTIPQAPKMPICFQQSLRCKPSKATLRNASFRAVNGRASISQCGYNTAMEIIQAQLPALVVPFADGGEDEQLKRARRLEALSAMRVLEQKQLTPKRMAEEMRKLLEFKPRTTDLDFDGRS